MEPQLSDGQSQWWAKCGTCGKASHAIQDKVHSVRSPVALCQPVSHVGKRNGQSIHRWVMPGEVFLDTVEYVTYPRRVRVNSTEPLVFSVWELLMSKVQVIMRPATGPGDNALEADARQTAMHQARGIAETLYILMDPFMASADDVVRHATRKYRDSEHQVPGLGEHLWDPHTNPDGSPRIPIATPKKRTPVAPKPAKPKPDNKSTRQLTPEEAEGIKAAVDSGMFSKEEVAVMFKVSVPTVEAALA